MSKIPDVQHQYIVASITLLHHDWTVRKHRNEAENSETMYHPVDQVCSPFSAQNQLNIRLERVGTQLL